MVLRTESTVHCTLPDDCMYDEHVSQFLIPWYCALYPPDGRVHDDLVVALFHMLGTVIYLQDVVNFSPKVRITRW